MPLYIGQDNPSAAQWRVAMGKFGLERFPLMSNHASGICSASNSGNGRGRHTANPVGHAAARLRDEIRRLSRHGTGGGRRPHGDGACHPAAGPVPPCAPLEKIRQAGGEPDETTCHTSRSNPAGTAGSKVHKPHLDEMHGPESLPCRPSLTLPQRPVFDDGDGNGGTTEPARPPRQTLRTGLEEAVVT